MPTQSEIAKHLDLSQPEVSRQLRELGLALGTPLRKIRLAYLRRLRESGAQVSSDDGVTLTHVRADNERLGRELKELHLAEVRAGLVNMEQLVPALKAMCVAAERSLREQDEKLCERLRVQYGFDIDIALLEPTRRGALRQLGPYAPADSARTDQETTNPF